MNPTEDKLMSTSMTLFDNAPPSTLLAGLEDTITSTIAGSAGGSRRISIRGNAFREIIGGKEVRVSEARTLNVVIINAAPVSRTYYEGAYVEGEAVRPTCWSADTQTPDPKVPAEQRQSARCMDCPQNIKGSGQNDSRACKYAQRIAVMLDGSLDKREVYQMQLPGQSVFGDADKGNMPLQAYGRFLQAHKERVMSVVTEVKFDVNSATPKLFFKAVRKLSDDEIRICLEMRDHPDTIKAITFTVSETDNVQKPAPSAAKAEPERKKPGRPAKPKPAPVVEEPEGDEIPWQEEAVAEEPEPVKAPSKKPLQAPPVEDSSLDSLLDDWDD